MSHIIFQVRDAPRALVRGAKREEEEEEGKKTVERMREMKKYRYLNDNESKIDLWGEKKCFCFASTVFKHNFDLLEAKRKKTTRKSIEFIIIYWSVIPWFRAAFHWCTFHVDRNAYDNVQLTQVYWHHPPKKLITLFFFSFLFRLRIPKIYFFTTWCHFWNFIFIYIFKR